MVPVIGNVVRCPAIRRRRPMKSATTASIQAGTPLPVISDAGPGRWPRKAGSSARASFISSPWPSEVYILPTEQRSQARTRLPVRFFRRLAIWYFTDGNRQRHPPPPVAWGHRGQDPSSVAQSRLCRPPSQVEAFLQRPSPAPFFQVAKSRPRRDWATRSPGGPATRRTVPRPGVIPGQAQMRPVTPPAAAAHGIVGSANP